MNDRREFKPTMITTNANPSPSELFTIRATARHVALIKAELPHGRRVLMSADFPSQLNSRIFADQIETSLLTQRSFQSSRSIHR